MASDDPFHQDTGLKDDYDGEIIDSWFAKDPAYNNGQTLQFYMKIAADDGEEVEVRYACGDQWDSFDGGQTAEHASKKFFNKQSTYGVLVQHAFEAGAEDVMRERSSKGRMDGDMPLGPRAAELWKGLRFHMSVVTTDRKIRGEDVSTSKAFPDKYLGIGDGSTVAAEPGGTVTPITDAPSSDPLAGVDSTIAAQLKILAKTHDYGSWVDEAMALTGVVENATLLSALGDTTFYESLKA